MFEEIERGLTVADPENHTLRLLREFRQEFKEFRKEFSEFHASTDERFDELLGCSPEKSSSGVTLPPTWTRGFML